MKSQPAGKGQVRIISGKWRGRKLRISNNSGLRPTPDRVRETLFNWLQPVINGANCLDLFAGSGALGFEALSRGAAGVTMVEEDRGSVSLLREHAQTLAANHLQIFCKRAEDYLQESTEVFDVVFLDPPFSANLLQKTCESLLNKGHLQAGALVYLENDSEIVSPADYTVYKQGKAGSIHFMLLANAAGGKTEL